MAVKRYITLAKGPSLNAARYGASCGVLTWVNPQSNQMEKIVVAAGGHSSYGDMSTTELLYVDKIGSYNWVMGPSLPSRNIYAPLVEFHNSVILIGGGHHGETSKDLFQLSSPGANVIKLFPWHCCFCKEATVFIIFF
jgi:hypothetical protein